MSKRQDILEVIRTRLAAIQVQNGYQTDAGDAVYLGEVTVTGEDDPETALAIVVGDDELQHHGVNVSVQLPIEIQVVAKADLEAPHQTIEAGIADVKQAMETNDRLFIVNGRALLTGTGMRRGRTRALPREEGTDTVGASIAYLLPYTEAWGGT